MKEVFILLTRTGTYPSLLIKMATRAEFTHASIAMTPCKHSLYSFARKKRHNFFAAGFIYEDVDDFMFAKFPNAPCAVYSIKISDAAHEKMLKRIAQFCCPSNKFKYNFIGLLTSQLGIKKKLKKHYTCSQFVASILDSSGEIDLPKHPSLIKPMDLAKIPNSKLIYSGKLKDISFHQQHSKPI